MIYGLLQADDLIEEDEERRHWWSGGISSFFHKLHADKKTAVSKNLTNMSNAVPVPVTLID
eukprot:scaffold3613_cov80-Skeletonema_marinoi.AAC.1